MILYIGVLYLATITLIRHTVIVFYIWCFASVHHVSLPHQPMKMMKLNLPYNVLGFAVYIIITVV